MPPELGRMLAQGGFDCSRETLVSGHSNDVLVDMWAAMRPVYSADTWLSPTGSCWIRRYRVARDMPKSRATWVGGSRASMSFIALRIWLSVKDRCRRPGFLPSAPVLAPAS